MTPAVSIDNIQHNNQGANLSGKLIVASPFIVKDSIFAESVVYIVHHDTNGAIGLIINHAIDNINCSVIFQSLDINPDLIKCKMPVHLGGPVEPEHGFVLHSSDYDINILFHNNDFSFSSNIEIVKAIAMNKGPANSLFALGYAGWSAQQLEAEITNKDWLVVPPIYDLIFAKNNDEKWHRALKLAGINPYAVTTTPGHA